MKELGKKFIGLIIASILGFALKDMYDRVIAPYPISINENRVISDSLVSFTIKCQADKLDYFGFFYIFKGTLNNYTATLISPPKTLPDSCFIINNDSLHFSLKSEKALVHGQEIKYSFFFNSHSNPSNHPQQIKPYANKMFRDKPISLTGKHSGYILPAYIVNLSYSMFFVSMFLIYILKINSNKRKRISKLLSDFSIAAEKDQSINLLEYLMAEANKAESKDKRISAREMVDSLIRKDEFITKYIKPLPHTNILFKYFFPKISYGNLYENVLRKSITELMNMKAQLVEKSEVAPSIVESSLRATMLTNLNKIK